MTTAEIISAHADKLNNDFESLCVVGGMSRRAFWESICSQYSNGVIKRFLRLRGVTPSALPSRMWSQVEDL